MERMFDDMEKHPEDSRNNREMDCESSLCNPSRLTDKCDTCCPADGVSVSSILEGEMQVLARNLMAGACSPELTHLYKFSGWRYEDEIE